MSRSILEPITFGEMSPLDFLRGLVMEAESVIESEYCANRLSRDEYDYDMRLVSKTKEYLRGLER